MQTTKVENIIRLKVEIKNNPAPPPPTKKKKKKKKTKKKNIFAH